MVIGCDVSAAARQTFIAAGGQAVVSPGDLPPDTEAALILVVNAAQEQEVLFGATGCVTRLPKGSVVLCSSTVSPDMARELEKRLNDAGLLMLDTPVSGGKAGADAGTITVMASGSAVAFAKAEPVLQAIAGKVWRLGDAAGIGSTVKMVNQLLAGPILRLFTT
jgi:3-hydroxyisobutyrate dehydrogenase